MSYIAIKTLGATTLIRLINDIPDFSGISNPTLSVLQSAYSDGDYEIIQDLEPPQENPQVDWSNFYDQLIMSQTYNFLQSKTIPYPSITGAMAAMAVALIKGQSDLSNPDRLAALQASVSIVLAALDAIGIPLSSEQLMEVRQLLDINGFSSIQLE
jgi:hypothetical protein